MNAIYGRELFDSVLKRHGKEYAIEFAERAVRVYRRAVLERRGLLLRREYILTYLTAKQWLNTHRPG